MVGFVRLLGTPAVRYEDGWLELPVGKTSALLYYLAYLESWVSRDDLLYLFWPDTPERSARQNLRPLLSKLRQLPYVQNLDSEKTRVQWPVQTDVQGFREAVAASQWSQAWDAYKGELLKGFNAYGFPEFLSWLELERASLHSAWRNSALAFASELEDTQRFVEAADVLAKLYRSDALDEEVARRYLRALYAAGRGSEAVTTYRSFAQLLHDELGSEPETATRDLISRIQRRESLGTEFSVTVRTGGAGARRHTLPAQATPFIGRGREKATVAAQLSDPDCRLLSIIGPGGIGKTRLALEVAAEQRAAFRDGVFFVPFEAVTEAEFMLSALASELAFALYGSQDPKVQLLDYLKDKELLLVLDNLEHLLEGAELLTDILLSSPRTKILATSRQRLDLQAEWVFDLPGMSFPAAPPATSSSSDDDLGRYDAVQLFLHAARRARGDFAADRAALRAIARICQLVDGMPLALELAARWLRLLSPSEITAQLANGLDLLNASTRDVPVRHRNMRAVFERSWQLLQPREQMALRKLSAFSGGFVLEAAQAVAGVNLPLLLALVNKSFLRRVPNGRFNQHPLVRQFAAEQAKAHPEELIQTNEQHGAYFMAFLAQRADAYRTSRGKTMLAEIEADIENIEAAWHWVAEHNREQWLYGGAASLGWFYHVRGWYERGLEVARFAQERARHGGLLHGRLLTSIGGNLMHQGRLEEGIPLLELGVTILEAHGSRPDLAWHLRVLGSAYGRGGPNYYQQRQEAYGRALELYRDLEDAEGIAMMLNSLSYGASSLEKSAQMLEESLSLAREHDAEHALALTLDTHAELLRYRKGDYAAAKDAMEECLSCLGTIGNALYHLLARANYARILIASGDVDGAKSQAREILLRSEPLEPRIADQVKAEAHSILGNLAYLDGELEKAQNLCEQSRLHGRNSMLRDVVTLSLDTLVRVSLAQCDGGAAEGWLQEAWEQLDAHPMGGNFRIAAAKISSMSLFGELASLKGDNDEAGRRLGEALRLARAWAYTPSALETLVGFSKLMEQRGQRKRAKRLCSFVAEHPASTWQTRNEARQVHGRRKD